MPATAIQLLVPHGLDVNKILSVTVLVEMETGGGAKTFVPMPLLQPRMLNTHIRFQEITLLFHQNQPIQV